MIPERMPVIGQNQHDGVLEVTDLVECGKEPADTRVHEGHFTRVQTADVTYFFGSRPSLTGPAHGKNETGSSIPGVGVGVKAGRRVPRLMWIKAVNPQEYPIVNAVLAKPGDSLSRHLRRKPIVL